MRRPFQQYAVSDPSPFSDEHPTLETTTPMTLNAWNNHSISFSSNSLHALCDTSQLMEGTSNDDPSAIPFVLNVNSGWMVGPKGLLLFWVPPASRYPFYSPETVLVIPRGSTELDLSRMAHGHTWQKCREG
ncbi:hypothetical protein BDR04DRAFT_1005728 [Suillus decipiens]|nr:hypothetical protein BDR04DRAFT_1005728 [Suillus decipiens]